MRLNWLKRITRIVPRSMRRPVRAAMVRWLDLSWTLPSGVRIRVENVPEWVVYNEIFASACYDPAITLALERTPGDAPLRVLDLGAHVGYFTLRVADRLRQQTPPRRFCATLVEADARLLGTLRARVVDENGLGDQVDILDGLAGRRDGPATLYVSREGDVFGSITQTRHTHPVQSRWVDLTRTLEQGIDLLKCDMEGAEQPFIETYARLLPHVRVAIVEFHPDRIELAACLAHLRAAGLTDLGCLRDEPTVTIRWFAGPGAGSGRR